VYESGEWEVDLARRELRTRGVPVPIGGRAFEIIGALVQSAGDLVTKDDLMTRVWSGAIVEENTLQVHVSAVRKALGPHGRMLKTVSGRGYRLLGTWTVRQESTPDDPIALPQMRMPTQPFLTNLPGTASELVGRETVAQHLRDLLSAYRAVTLTGPGGIGKTALALDVARSLFPTFQGDVCLVELASLSDPGLVPSRVAGAIGLKLGGGDEISAESVARAIGGKKLLLVLDSCEHVVDAAAGVAETALRLCPRTSVLATSREVMRIEGEYVYRVPALDVPPLNQQEPETVLGHSAVQLFVARTSALRSEFSPDGERLPAIAAICRRLDGIPLAIEFAAARAATLGVRQVASRLDDRFGLLTGGRRTALPRHQTLRATLDWSYELLPETERCLLRRLAVFSGGFTLEAASAVMSDIGNVASAIVEGIANLVAKSLVAFDASAPVRRWRLLETIRAYALEKLAESGEAEHSARRHAEFFRDHTAPAAPGSQSEPTIDDMARYVREIDNVRAALDWSFSPGGDSATGVVLTAAYAPVWLHFELMAECRERTERALESLDPDLNGNAPLRMQLHIALGVALTFTMGAVERIGMVLAKALEVAESLDDSDAQLRTLWCLCALYWDIGDCRAARSTAERFSRVAHRTGDPAAVLVGDRLIGTTLQTGGQQGEARRCFERVLELYVAPKDRRDMNWFQFDQRVLARAMLARVLWLQGFLDQAKNQAQASLEEAQATPHVASRLYALFFAVFPVSVMTGDLVAAERAVAMLIDFATRHNATYWMNLGRCLEGKLLIERTEFGSGSARLRAALETCDRTGWTVSYPEFLGVLAEALGRLGERTDALATVERALARTNRGGERWYASELTRIKGELLLQEAGDQSIAAAEGLFLEALEVARQQGALFWELRGALSLARLRVRQDRRGDARRTLAPVYERFTEGFKTADLRSAKALLDSLPPSRTSGAR